MKEISCLRLRFLKMMQVIFLKVTICDLGFASARNIRQLAELGYMDFLGLE